MEPLPSVRTFTKLRKAIYAINKGICLGTLVKLSNGDAAGPWLYPEEVEGQYDDNPVVSEEVLGHEELEESLRGGSGANDDVQTMFCCGGRVILPSHDVKSVVLKLFDGSLEKKMGRRDGSSGTTDVQATVTQPLSELKVQEMIAHCSVAGFGDLKEGATVVDASVRRAWESFFDLDFDYSWQRSDFPQDYVVGLHPMTIRMLILNHREKSQRDLFGLQASVEHVEIQYKKNASAVGWKRKADEAFTPGISVKATVNDKNRVLTTKIRATKDDDRPVNVDSLAYECECGRTSKPSLWWRTVVWCEHALATVEKVQDKKWGTRHAEAQFREVLFLRPILAHVKRNLAHGVPVNLVPYKLNLYGEGGFSKKHVDTPRDVRNMIGMLVVCLPSEHEGGELVVSHGGADHTFDFAPLSGQKDTVQWAAMCGDCVHEVKPVTKGYRATLTFGIYRERYLEKQIPEYRHLVCTELRDDHYPKIENVFQSGPACPTPSETAPEPAVAALRGLPPSYQYAAVLLSHSYTQENLLTPDILKGADWALFEAASKVWMCELLAVATSDTWTAEDDRTVLSCHAFSKADIDWLAGDGPRPFHAWCESAQNGGLKLVALKSMERVFLDVETTGYTGNDFEEDGETVHVYFQAALIVDLTSPVAPI